MRIDAARCAQHRTLARACDRADFFTKRARERTRFAADAFERSERLIESERTRFHALRVHIAMRTPMFAIDETRLRCEIEFGKQGRRRRPHATFNSARASSCGPSGVFAITRSPEDRYSPSAMP